MQRYYGIDTTDLWRGTLTLRRLRVLLVGLPPDSNTAYALASHAHDVDHLAGWSMNDLLLGRLVDELAAYRWQWEAAHIERRTNHRKEPVPVLPQARAQAVELRVVSPHSLGDFVNDDPGR